MTQQFTRATPEEEYVPKKAPGSGCVSLFFLFFSVIGAVVAAITIHENFGNMAGISAAVVFGIICLVWLVMLLKRNRIRIAERTGTDVLRSILDFNLPAEYYDVGLTAFCRPDALGAGEATALLIFAQNYSNRPRRVVLKVPRNSTFGFQTTTILRWELSPGQCLVYRKCFEVPVDTKPGVYDMAMLVSVKLPKGQGARLIPKVRKEKGVTVTRLRSTTFGIQIKEHQDGNVTIPSGECPPAQLISLYTPALAEPRFEVLQQLTTGEPREQVEI